VIDTTNNIAQTKTDIDLCLNSLQPMGLGPGGICEKACENTAV
jgi:hypothetical protein